MYSYAYVFTILHMMYMHTFQGNEQQCTCRNDDGEKRTETKLTSHIIPAYISATASIFHELNFHPWIAMYNYTQLSGKMTYYLHLAMTRCTCTRVFLVLSARMDVETGMLDGC